MRHIGNYHDEDAAEAIEHYKASTGFNETTVLVRKPKPCPGYPQQVMIEMGLVGLYDPDKRQE